MNLKRIALAVFSFLAILLLVLALSKKELGNKPSPPLPSGPPPSQNLGASTWEAKADQQGGVSVEVRPIELSKTAITWKFAVVLSTHSVELNEDLAQTAVLVDDQGQEYRPTSWDGSPPGGHHREGELLFKPVVPRPSFVELKVRAVGGIQERVFKWDLK